MKNKFPYTLNDLSKMNSNELRKVGDMWLEGDAIIDLMTDAQIINGLMYKYHKFSIKLFLVKVLNKNKFGKWLCRKFKIFPYNIVSSNVFLGKTMEGELINLMQIKAMEDIKREENENFYKTVYGIKK